MRWLDAVLLILFTICLVTFLTLRFGVGGSSKPESEIGESDQEKLESLRRFRRGENS